MANSLITNDLEIQRYYFDEACDFYGIPARYFQVKPGMHWTVAGEMSSNFFDPIKTRPIFDEAPKVSTLKKLGWVPELNEEVPPLAHLSFTLPGLQVGCLLEVKDPLAVDKGRMFRITKMKTGIIYPASVTCQIVPIVGSDTEATVTPYEGEKTLFLDKKESREEY